MLFLQKLNIKKQKHFFLFGNLSSHDQNKTGSRSFLFYAILLNDINKKLRGSQIYETIQGNRCMHWTLTDFS